MRFAAEPTARILMRTARTAALATLDTATGAPFASLVTVATAPDGAPLLLLSALAVHTRNLAVDPRASLLVDDRSSHTAAGDPLAGSRVTVVGAIVRLSEPDAIAPARRRFLARHRDAEGYVGFGDFGFYRMDVVSAHLVAGFGRIETIAGTALVRPIDAAEGLVAAEPDVLAELNRDHASVLRRVAMQLGRPEGDWRAIGADPYGLDLECSDGGRTLDARLEFAAPVSAAVELTTLLQRGKSSD